MGVKDKLDLGVGLQLMRERGKFGVWMLATMEEER